MPGPTIRLARPEEASILLAIEDDAGRLYGCAGLPDDLEGLDPELVDTAIANGLTWVVVDEHDHPIGFALCMIFGDALHLRELDVAPDHMRRGLGRALVEFVCARAAERGLARVTLTTFAEIDWNAPLYRRWGFEVLDRETQPDWLAQIRDHEDQGELGRWPRVAMARVVYSSSRSM